MDRLSGENFLHRSMGNSTTGHFQRVLQVPRIEDNSVQLEYPFVEGTIQVYFRIDYKKLHLAGFLFCTQDTGWVAVFQKLDGRSGSRILLRVSGFFHSWYIGKG